MPKRAAAPKGTIADADELVIRLTVMRFGSFSNDPLLPAWMRGQKLLRESVVDFFLSTKGLVSHWLYTKVLDQTGRNLWAKSYKDAGGDFDGTIMTAAEKGIYKSQYTSSNKTRTYSTSEQVIFREVVAEVLRVYSISLDELKNHYILQYATDMDSADEICAILGGLLAFYTGRSQPDLHCIPQVLCASSVAHVGTVDLKAPSSYSVDILSNEVLKAYVVVRGLMGLSFEDTKDFFKSLDVEKGRKAKTLPQCFWTAVHAHLMVYRSYTAKRMQFSEAVRAQFNGIKEVVERAPLRDFTVPELLRIIKYYDALATSGQSYSSKDLVAWVHDVPDLQFWEFRNAESLRNVKKYRMGQILDLGFAEGLDVSLLYTKKAIEAAGGWDMLRSLWTARQNKDAEKTKAAEAKSAYDVVNDAADSDSDSSDYDAPPPPMSPKKKKSIKGSKQKPENLSSARRMIEEDEPAASGHDDPTASEGEAESDPSRHVTVPRAGPHILAKLNKSSPRKGKIMKKASPQKYYAIFKTKSLAVASPIRTARQAATHAACVKDAVDLEAEFQEIPEYNSDDATDQPMVDASSADMEGTGTRS